MNEGTYNPERYTKPEGTNEAEQMKDLVESGLAENYEQAESLVEAHERVFKLIDELSQKTGGKVGGINYASEAFWREFPNIIAELPIDKDAGPNSFSDRINFYISHVGEEENYAVSGHSTFILELRRKFVDEIVKASGLLTEEEFKLFQQTRLSSIFSNNLVGDTNPSPNRNAILRAKNNLDKLKEIIGEQKLDELTDFVKLADDDFRLFIAGQPKLFSAEELVVLLREYRVLRKNQKIQVREFIPEKIADSLNIKYPGQININPIEYARAIVPTPELVEKYPDIFTKLNNNQLLLLQSVLHSKGFSIGHYWDFNDYLEFTSDDKTKAIVAAKRAAKREFNKKYKK